MQEDVPDYLLPVEKEEKNNCTTVEIVICAVVLSICSSALFVWLIAFPWACIALDMAYHNLANEAGTPGNAPLSDRLFTGAVMLMVILYPAIFFFFLIITILRLNSRVIKFNSPILFASIPLVYILFLVLLVAVQ